MEELEFHVVRAGTLSVHVQHKDGDGGRRAEGAAVADRPLRPAAGGGQRCFRRAWRPGRPATYMHVIASDLRRPGGFQPGLFDPPDEQGPRRRRRQAARSTPATGRFTLRSGATLPLYDVYRDEAQAYDICDVRGKICF